MLKMIKQEDRQLMMNDEKHNRNEEVFVLIHNKSSHLMSNEMKLLSFVSHLILLDYFLLVDDTFEREYWRLVNIELEINKSLKLLSIVLEY